MAVRYRIPRDPFQQLRQEMDRLLTGLRDQLPDVAWAWPGRSQPAVNLWEEDDSLVAELEVPGVKSDQVDVSVVGAELSLKIERPERQPEGATYHRRERPAGTFTRVLRLPCEVDADRVEAELKDGVLTIRLPKAEAAKPRKIRISTG